MLISTLYLILCRIYVGRVKLTYTKSSKIKEIINKNKIPLKYKQLNKNKSWYKYRFVNNYIN